MKEGLKDSRMIKRHPSVPSALGKKIEETGESSGVMDARSWNLRKIPEQ
jgi:hypothetical protein